MTLEYAFFLTIRSIMILTFIISLVFCYKNYNPKYLYFFPAYHLVALLTEGIVDIYFSDNTDSLKAIYSTPYNLFAYSEFIFFTLFISTQLKEKQYKIAVFACACVCILIIGILLYRSKTLNYHTWKGAIPLNIFYLVCCLLYFLNIFSNKAHFNLSKEPAFWIITGLLFYSIIDTPFLAIYAQTSHLSSFLYLIINGTAYLFLHLFFIRAYTCRATR